MASSYPPVLLCLVILPFMSSLNFTFIILKGVVWLRPPSDRVPGALAAPPQKLGTYLHPACTGSS